MPVTEGQDNNIRSFVYDESAPPQQSDNGQNVSVQNDDDLLTIQVAARRAGVSRASVLSWIRNGFISAQTSPNGWMVRAGDIEQARDGADEARRGTDVDGGLSEESRSLAPDAEQVSEQSRSLASRPVDSGYGRDRQSDAFLAPLAEFVRDQADVVQEQAETIGWLQAELRRAQQQLEEIEARKAAAEASEVEPALPVHEEEGTDLFQSERAPMSYPDPFASIGQADAFAPVKDVHAASYDIIAADPFSEEAARARMMIEETERKITDLWAEQQQKQERHSRSHSHQSTHDDSWLRRIVHSWKKQESH